VDAFFERNRVDERELAERIRQDLILSALEKTGVEARTVLEVGASDGWRLEALHSRDPDLVAVGIDPSRAALRDGTRRFSGVELTRGTAERLPFSDRSFDLVILGFCLYVVDRDDLFRVAAEVERVIATSGVVALLDFHSDTPLRTPYRAIPGRYSYKMNYGEMFAWNPVYRRIHEQLAPHPGSQIDDPGGRVAVTLLKRDPDCAYRDRPIHQTNDAEIQRG
jgi:ubiquinone/menaquinone biosynthesis C-methylase UbiE